MAALCSRREICSGQARQMLERFLQRNMSASGTGTSALSTGSTRSSKGTGALSTGGTRTASADSSQSAIIDSVIKMLLGDSFIDDRRFLAAYLKDKIAFAGWGPKKISVQLTEWGFEQKTVDEALAERKEELNASLRKLLEKKREQLNRESAKKLESAKAKFSAKIEKLQAALNEAEVELEEAKECGKNAAVANAFKNLKSVNQKLQRAKYEASISEKALGAANRKKLISFGVSRGFALKDILALI